MKKRITAIFLIVSVLISATVFVGAEENAEPSNELNVIKALGIFDEEVNFADNVTRGGVLEIMLRLSAYPFENSQVNQIYKDVPETHKYAPAVSAATQIGIISGTSEGNYHPDDALNCDSAVKMLACVMGYGKRAEMTGGFVSGYYRAARDMKMDIMGGDTVTYDDLAK